MYRERVREGFDLDAAREFAQWVMVSELAKIIKPYDCKQPLVIDSAALFKMAKDLQVAVQEQWEQPKFAPKPHTSNLEEISRKLELIASHTVQLSIRMRNLESAFTGKAAQEEPTKLTVIDGGKKSDCAS